MTAANDSPMADRRGADVETTWAGALAETRAAPSLEVTRDPLEWSRAGKESSTSSTRGPIGDWEGAERGVLPWEEGVAVGLARPLMGGGRCCGLGPAVALLSTMFAMRATSRSSGAILETIRSNSCLTSEGGVAAGAGVGVGGVVIELERGRGPESRSLREETAPGAGRSSSMVLPGAYIEAEEDSVSALKSIVGRGSSGPDIDQSRGAVDALGVVSSSSATGQEEGSWWEVVLAAGEAELAFSVVLRVFPTLARLGGLGMGVAESCNKPSWMACVRM
jgi:hypothetical protein